MRWCAHVCVLVRSRTDAVAFVLALKYDSAPPPPLSSPLSGWKKTREDGGGGTLDSCLPHCAGRRKTEWEAQISQSLLFSSAPILPPRAMHALYKGTRARGRFPGLEMAGEIK